MIEIWWARTTVRFPASIEVTAGEGGRIHLEDGEGRYSFDPLEGDFRFWLRIPQWFLRDSREITFM